MSCVRGLGGGGVRCIMGGMLSRGELLSITTE